jgi:hypothetical protein
VKICKVFFSKWNQYFPYFICGKLKYAAQGSCNRKQSAKFFFIDGNAHCYLKGIIVSSTSTVIFSSGHRHGSVDMETWWYFQFSIAWDEQLTDHWVMQICRQKIDYKWFKKNRFLKNWYFKKNSIFFTERNNVFYAIWIFR